MSFIREENSKYRYKNDVSQWPQATEEMKGDFRNNGYIIVNELFSKNEADKLIKALEACQDFKNASFALSDLSKATYDQAQWMEPGTDVLGLAAGNAKTCGVAEQLLDRGEIYMYSGKVIMKQKRTGGALLWHQDYGYWYNNRAVFPDFITCIIALTKSDRENGGVQVISGSQLCGRINHVKSAGQTSADLERVEMILEKLPLVHVDLAPGDCVFFHSNMLHKSEANNSEYKRWNLIFSYNAKSNSPDKSHYNAIYGLYELRRYEADSLINCEDITIHKRDYLDPNTNPNINTKA